jgi:ribonucleoside-diphosphate reductase alpha chain
MSEVKISDTAKEVLERRYLVKDDNGQLIETPDDLFHRVANVVAKAEDKFKKGPKPSEMSAAFYQLMADFDFLPNSPTLMNAGRPLGQLSACFVLPVGDSMEEIFQAIKDTAMIHKSGGGTGFSFTRLRPSGDIVRATQGASSGPISFMTAFDAATETVKQGGKRRGANMGILRVDHPDILSFITCKEDNGKLNNFNISVAVTEKFMKAVEEDKEYELINPHDNQVAGKLRAKEVYDLIVKQAWKNGEPGIVFIDRMNKDNPTPNIGEIEATNPCGEQPLLPYEACNLGSINLSNFVAGGKIDFPRLKEVTRLAVRFLDDVIEVNKYPIKQIDKMTRSNRKIGLGVMGFADMLVQLEVPYNSEEAVTLAEKVMKAIQVEGHKMSTELAAERGTFENFKGSTYDKKGQKMRNATITTIAPTGTISMIADASSGVEPLFAISFIKNVMDKDELVMTNSLFLDLAKERGFYSEDLMKEIAEKGTLHGIKGVPSDVKKYFVVAHDVSPEWHIKIQAAFQKYTDNAVSKTVNFPHTATQKDVAEVYKLAYQMGAKGVTIYRDGSRDEQVLNIGSVNKETNQVEVIIQEQAPRIRKRPQITSGRTIQMTTGCGKLYVTVNFDEEGNPFEIFSTMGKAGGCASSQAEALSRMVSMALRSEMDPKVVIKHLKSISCHRPAGFGPNKVSSCSDAIAQALEIVTAQPKLELFADEPTADEAPAIQEEIIFTQEVSAEPIPDDGHGNRESHIGGICPECGGPIEYEGGCLVCRSCGYSECA